MYGCGSRSAIKLRRCAGAHKFIKPRFEALGPALRTSYCNKLVGKPLPGLRHFHISNVWKDDDVPTPTVDEPPLSSALRTLMRGMPHSVVVATANTGEGLTSSSFKAMTVSSFTTFTLTPTPIITFNIKKPSQTLEAIRKSRSFLIHILSATDSGARVADAFTRGNDQNVFSNSAFEVMKIKNANSQQEPPLLSAKGITKVLRCKVRDQPGNGLLDIGDHTLILGDVVGIIEPPATVTENNEKRGLCYLDREYRGVGSIIDIETL